jgi:hypothetical protein
MLADAALYFIKEIHGVKLRESAQRVCHAWPRQGKIYV